MNNSSIIATTLTYATSLVLFAALEDLPAEGLQHIIQMVIFAVTGALVFSMGRKVQTLGSGDAALKNGMNKLTGSKMGKAVRAGAAERFKKRAAFTASNLGQKLADKDKARFGSYPARAIGTVSGFRRNRAASAKMRERALEARKAEREGKIDELTAERITKPSGGLDRAVRAVGGERVAAYAKQQTSKHFAETIDREKATLSTAGTQELARALRDALREGNSERAHAASELLNKRGAVDRIVAGDVLRKEAGSAAPTSDLAKTAASIISSNGPEFNSVSPDLARWSGQDPNAPGAKTIDGMAANHAAYSNASQEKMLDWSPDTIQRAFAEAQATGINPKTGVAALDEFKDKVNNIMGTPLLAGKLSDDSRILMQKVQAGAVLSRPAPKTDTELYGR